MTVFDASVLVDSVVVVGRDGEDAREALRNQSTLVAPAIFTAEATSAVRSMFIRGEISPQRASAALGAIRRARTVQYPFEPFLDRVWELRHNLTVYDGWYAALAESLGMDLVTADARLAGATGPRCRIRTVSAYVAARRPPDQDPHPSAQP